jgi:Sec-independent protein secretion pathway component TatC
MPICLLAFGLVFELPLLLTFVAVVGLVNSRVLRAKRICMLFELTILLMHAIGTRCSRQEAV